MPARDGCPMPAAPEAQPRRAPGMAVRRPLLLLTWTPLARSGCTPFVPFLGEDVVRLAEVETGHHAGRRQQPSEPVAARQFVRALGRVDVGKDVGGTDGDDEAAAWPPQSPRPPPRAVCPAPAQDSRDPTRLPVGAAGSPAACPPLPRPAGRCVRRTARPASPSPPARLRQAGSVQCVEELPPNLTRTTVSGPGTAVWPYARRNGKSKLRAREGARGRCRTVPVPAAEGGFETALPRDWRGASSSTWKTDRIAGGTGSLPGGAAVEVTG